MFRHQCSMEQIVCPEVVELQARIFAHRLKLPAVLKRAGVHRSSWHRWSHGGDVRNSSIAKMRTAIDGMIEERHVANTPVPFPTFEPEQAASLAPSDDAAAQA